MNQFFGVQARGKTLSGTLFQSQATSGSHAPVSGAIAQYHRCDGRSYHLHDPEDVVLASRRRACDAHIALAGMSVQSRHH